MNDRSTSWVRYIRNRFAGAAIGASAMLGGTGCVVRPPQTPALVAPHVDTSYAARNEKLYRDLNDAVDPAGDEIANLISNPLQKMAFIFRQQPIFVAIYPAAKNDAGSQIILWLNDKDPDRLVALGCLLDKMMAVERLRYEMQWDGIYVPAPDFGQVEEKLVARLKNVDIPFVTEERKRTFIHNFLHDTLSKVYQYSYDVCPGVLRQRNNNKFDTLMAACQNRRLGEYGARVVDYNEKHYPVMKCDFKPQGKDSVNEIAFAIPDMDTLTKWQAQPLDECRTAIVRECISFLQERQKGFDQPNYPFDTSTTPNVTINVYNPSLSHDIFADRKSAIEYRPDVLNVGPDARGR